MGLPDVHSGYGFAIGNMAAFDTSDPQSVVSPGKSLYEWSRVASYPFSDFQCASTGRPRYEAGDWHQPMHVCTELTRTKLYTRHSCFPNFQQQL